MILSNLLVVPVEESLLYVQPIFVQGSAPNSFPLLQQVAVFYNDKVGYADNLEGRHPRGRQRRAAHRAPTRRRRRAATPDPHPAAATSPSRASSPRPTRNTRPPRRALAAGDLAEYQRHIDTMGQPAPAGPGRQGDGGRPHHNHPPLALRPFRCATFAAAPRGGAVW